MNQNDNKPSFYRVLESIKNGDIGGDKTINFATTMSCFVNNDPDFLNPEREQSKALLIPFYLDFLTSAKISDTLKQEHVAFLINCYD